MEISSVISEEQIQNQNRLFLRDGNKFSYLRGADSKQIIFGTDEWKKPDVRAWTLINHV